MDLFSDFAFKKNPVGARKLALIALSGMLGYGVGGVACVLSMQRVGAGRTVLITSLPPVLVLTLSVFCS
jgi:drug/metabolite transporter (DMT)-like permease